MGQIRGKARAIGGREIFFKKGCPYKFFSKAEKETDFKAEHEDMTAKDLTF